MTQEQVSMGGGGVTMTWSACTCIAQSGCSISKYMGYVLPAGKYGTIDSGERHCNYREGGFLCNFAVDWTT